MIISLYPFYYSSAYFETNNQKEASIVITRRDIQDMGIHNIVDLLNHAAGVNASETSVSLRGSSSKQVLVLLDERPLNDPISGSVNLEAVSVNNIEKIEIYKGAGSAVYGGDTIGGIVRITTRKINKNPGGKAEFSYGSFDTRKYDLHYTQSSGNIGWSVSGMWNKTHGHRANDDQDKKSGVIKLNYQLKKDSGLSCGVNYSKKESGSPGRIDYPTPRAESDKEDWGVRMGCNGKEWKINAYASGFDKRNINPDISLDYTMKSNVIGGDIIRSFSVPYLEDLVLGTGAKKSKVDAAKVGHHEENQLSLFGEKEVEFENLPLSLCLGIRGRHHSMYDWALNPQYGITYSMEQGEIQFAVSRATTIPSFYERYARSTSREGNPDLLEEKAINYHMGIRNRFFNDSLKTSISFFYSDIDDLISYVEGEDRIYRYTNIKSAFRNGLELETEIHPFDRLIITGAYTRLTAKNDDTGRYIAYQPKHRASVSLRYAPLKNLIFYLRDEYVSTRFTNHENTETLSGYNLVDFEIKYLMGKATLFGKIENLFGEEYELHKKYPQPGATFAMGMTYEF